MQFVRERKKSGIAVKTQFFAFAPLACPEQTRYAKRNFPFRFAADKMLAQRRRRIYNPSAGSHHKAGQKVMAALKFGNVQGANKRQRLYAKRGMRAALSNSQRHRHSSSKGNCERRKTKGKHFYRRPAREHSCRYYAAPKRSSRTSFCRNIFQKSLSLCSVQRMVYFNGCGFLHFR